MKLIAETAWHHQGDFAYFRRLVKSIAMYSMADIIKVHITMNLDEYMNSDHPLYLQLKDWLLTAEQWIEILDIIVDSNKQLMILFNDMDAIEFGMRYKPEYVEIHSVSLNDVKLFDKLKEYVLQQTKIFLGVGGSTFEEYDKAINCLNHKNTVLMHGFQNYPTNYSDINFRKIRTIMGIYKDFQHGYADHTAWNEPNNLLITLLGASHGMDYVEKHVTIDYGVEKADWSAAISIEMFNRLCEKSKIIEECMGSGELTLNQAELQYCIYGPMKKAAILNRNIKKDEIFSLDMIDFKRTGQKADLSQVEVINNVARQFSQDVNKGQVLLKKHLVSIVDADMDITKKINRVSS